jgi:hypothetical protein
MQKVQDLAAPDEKATLPRKKKFSFAVQRFADSSPITPGSL